MPNQLFFLPLQIFLRFELCCIRKKMFSIFGKNFYFGGDMLHNFQNNTSKRAPGNTEYFQFGTGMTHAIDDFYNYFYPQENE